MSIGLTAGMTGALYLRNPLLLEMQARVIKKGQSLIRNKNYQRNLVMLLTNIIAIKDVIFFQTLKLKDKKSHDQ